MRLAVVADTHSVPHPSLGERLAAARPDAILHAGDIGDLAVLDGLARGAPVHAVRGNIDGRENDLPDVLTLDVVYAAQTALRILMVHIGVMGSRLRPEVARLAHERSATLVVCGHSHVPLIARDRGVAVFNPGSAGPRRFQLPIVFGLVDVTGEAVGLAHYECATGERWVPDP